MALINFWPPTARRAFSLIEMMTTVAFIGAVLMLALPAYFSSKDNQDKIRCDDQMLVIARAEEQYRVRNRAYTTNLAQLDLSGNVYELPVPTPSPTGTPSTTLKIKCNRDTVNRDFSYTVTTSTDTDGSPAFTVKEACGLHTLGKARQLVSNRNGLATDSKGIKIEEVACQ